MWGDAVGVAVADSVAVRVALGEDVLVGTTVLEGVGAAVPVATTVTVLGGRVPSLQAIGLEVGTGDSWQ